MQLPPSTIVMALLTCVPFGLAIRDTVSGKDRASDLDGLAEDHDHLERYAGEGELERQREVREVREAREAATRAEMRKELFDVVPAALAGSLASLRLGEPIDEILDVTETSLARLGEQTGTEIRLDGDVTLDAITISFGDGGDDLCDRMDGELRARWGAPVKGVWWNEATRVRARLEDGADCTLTLERAVDPTEWYAQTSTAIIPLGAIGRAPAWLLQTLRGDYARIPDWAAAADAWEHAWTAPGVGRGEGTTRMAAIVDNDKVVTIRANTQVTPEDGDVLVEHLVAIHGKPTTEDASFVWKKAKPAVKLELDSGYAYLTVGKLSD